VRTHLLLIFALTLAACGPTTTTSTDAGALTGGGAGGGTTTGGGGGTTTGGGTGGGGSGTFAGIQHVFVIVMENRSDTSIYGSASAPYLNQTLLAQYGHATHYTDVLGSSIPSEPHYVWLEAGTNTFSDHTFLVDDAPSASNVTSSTQHLATQLTQAGKTWRSYQEGLDANTGACPIKASGTYAPKHDPFIFFADVAGNPPSATNAECAAHHRAYTPAALQADLAANDVADYTFITPDLCNDMHGASACTNGCTSDKAPQSAACIAGGDAWLAANVPAILAWVSAHDGVLFIAWDEPEGSGTTTAFVVAGPHVKAGYAAPAAYSHGAYVRTLGRIFGLPTLATVAAAPDFADFFEAGFFP
jgi:phospholipase C